MTKLIDRAIELLKKPVPDTCGGVYKALAPDSRINFDLLPADTEVMFCESNCRACGSNVYISSAALYLLAQAYCAVQSFCIPRGPYSSAELHRQIALYEWQQCRQCNAAAPRSIPASRSYSTRFARQSCGVGTRSQRPRSSSTASFLKTSHTART